MAGGNWQRSRPKFDRNKSSQRKKQLCRYFAAGTCRFGANCNFSHGESTDDAGRGSQKQARSPPAPLDESTDLETLNEWKYMIRKRPSSHHAHSLKELWETALQILNGKSPQNQQQLVKDLVDDNFYGGIYVIYTLQTKVDLYSETDMSLVEGFLRTITHFALLDCLSVSTFVGTLYNMISGVGGNNSVPFFSNVLSSLQAELKPELEHPQLERYAQISNSLIAALHELVIREKRSSFHESMPGLLSGLDSMSKDLDETAARLESQVKVNRNRLATVCRIVGLATGLIYKGPVQDQDISSVLQTSTVSSLAYRASVQEPGGRHDNDHAEITDIAIMPTANELLSDREEFLPPTDVHLPHPITDPIRRYLDTHFRLLRHDVYGPLKTALGSVVASLGTKATSHQPPSVSLGLHMYQKASIRHLSMHEKFGFEVHISFTLPGKRNRTSREERRLRWEQSKRLETGVLVTLLSPLEEHPSLMLIAQKKSDGKSEQETNEWQNHQTVRITAKLASLREADLLTAVRMYRNKVQGVLLEVPGLIPSTFCPILANIQEVQKTGDLPFQQHIIPSLDCSLENERREVADIEPPQYARQPGFQFDLKSILIDKTKSLVVEATASPDDESLLSKLEEHTSLDYGQCRALVSALTREFALIQGPPGTGKSYLGVQLLQVLMDCKRRASLGPIMIICYTNHALDQFLCHLLDVGIDNMVRIGGRSRSPRLDCYNLRAVTNGMLKTKHENYLIGSTYGQLDKQTRVSGQRLAAVHALRKGSDWKAIKRRLQSVYPKIYQQIYQDEEDGYTVVGRDPLEVWVNPGGQYHATLPRSRAPRNDEDRDLRSVIQSAERNIQATTQSERQSFLDALEDICEKEEAEKLLISLEMGEALRDQIDSAHEEVKRRALLQADVVGVTTTGLAKEAPMLRRLRSKIVICEEAGEVLEAHVITALMPGVEHFIQIGDHQQLRPQINNYLLSLESKTGLPYQLDRSQFERLAVGQPGLAKVPVAQLNLQRRMRPDISRLIQPLYKQLHNHASVLDLPNVVGMKDNVFWLDHRINEDGMGDGDRVLSHSNEWEIGLAKALARHIIRQGKYSGTDVALLTPYSGQLSKLRTALNSEFEVSISDRDEEQLAADGFELDFKEASRNCLQKRKLAESLRLATVDNFQGEEAKVVIVSLVRSNSEGKVGFLRTINRINVLLSRAQHGLYLIGNSHTYGNIQMWVDVQDQLSKRGCMGRSFNLCCPRHPDTIIQTATPEEFLTRSPEGGCSLPCDLRLEQCGHQCLAKCHSAAMHSVFLCPRPCPRRRASCDHSCPKTCGEECELCLVPVDGTILLCGHVKDGLACHLSQKPSDIVCKKPVLKTVLSCGHDIEVSCATDVKSPTFSCTAACTATLACGHACRSTCGRCSLIANEGNGRIHPDCRKTCGRPRNTCGHTCKEPCHQDKPCPPCPEKCQVLCAHSKCAQSCAEPCAPCIERCAWSCEHQGGCSMPCAAPCDRLPCDKRCSKSLDCGHQCPGLCGETCPQGYCQTCGLKNDARVDLLEMKTFSEVDLDETPIVVLSCGHFFTAECVDGLVGLNAVYEINAHGLPSGLLEPPDIMAVPRCPDCKQAIRQHTTRRYNRAVNHAVMNETSKRFLVNGQSSLQDLQEEIDKATMELQNSGAPVPKTLRHANLRSLLERARRFCKLTSQSQQPAQKLFDAIIATKARSSLESRFGKLGLSEQSAPVPEYRIVLGGQLACLQISEVMFHDQISVIVPSVACESGLGELYKSAESLLQEYQDLVDGSVKTKLPRFSIAAALGYARVVSTARAKLPEFDKAGNEKLTKARAMLKRAESMCEESFQGSEKLRVQVQQAMGSLGQYKEVTKEELDSIKSAMLSGPSALRTHSGHWYQCERGHPFAIGECGMPMEQARCPECGASIGGQHHQMVAGPSRAIHMED